MKAVAWILTLLLTSSPFTPSSADTEPTQTESSSEGQPLTYGVEVELLQVPVRVTTKEGKWVSGLTKEDFELLEDGEKQAIRYVDEMTAGNLPEAPAETIHYATEQPEIISDPEATNTVLLLIDGTNTGKISIEKHKKHLVEFLEQYSAPNTQFTLISLKQTGDYEIIQPLTPDKALIQKSIQSVQGSIAGTEERTLKASRLVDTFALEQCAALMRRIGLAGIDCSESALRGIIVRANSYAVEEQSRTFMTFRSIRKVFEVARHMPGQKSVILVSEGWDPGGIFYQNYAANSVDYLIDRYQLPPSLRNLLKESKLDAERIGSGLQQIRDLVKLANASNLTLYWVNPDYGRESANSSAEMGIPSRFGFKYYNAPDIKTTMMGIAEDTGGFALSSTNMTRFYEQIGTSIPRYYIVSYKPDHPINDGEFRRIEIKVKEKDTDYRLTYKKDVRDFSTEDRITALLAEMHDFPKPSDFEILNEVNYFRKSESEYRTVIRAGMPYEEIEPKMNGESVHDDVHFSFLIRGEDGNVVLQTHPVIQVRSSRNEFEGLQDRNAVLEYTQSCELKAGHYDVSVVVMDSAASKVAEKTISVDLPEPHASCFTLSPVLLASSSTTAESNAETPVSNDKGQIHYGNQTYNFGIEKLFPTQGSLSGFYQIYNADVPSVFVGFKLYRDNTFINQTGEREVTAYTDPTQKLISSFFSVPYKNLPPGSYEFEISARDKAGKCISSSRVPFQVADSGGS